ncbi:MAG: disulfide bond formation protein DsbA, partial [Actinomycetia bacterium]|nr:disulfide bond formation protein DsbA [Actinomycetes bacterium]
DFSGLRTDHWPLTTIPALNLAAQAYARNPATGLAVSLATRIALFEGGLDISDPEVLADIAAEHGLSSPETEASPAIRADYDEGRARGVNGSPHFWIGDDDFFCPALDLGHDPDGNLTARFDADGLAQFFSRIDQ